MNLKILKEKVAANRQSLIYSLIIVFNHFAFGISNNIIGATMVDLRHIFGVSINTISYVQVATSFGYVIGSLVGWLYDRGWLNRQLALVGFVLLQGITIALVPHYPSFPVAVVCLVLFGIGIGSWDASSSYWLVLCWPEGNAVALMLHQFLYSCGATVAPLLAATYVRGEATLDDAANITANERRHLLTVPFAIDGALHLFAPTALLLLYFSSNLRYHPPSPAAARNLNRKFSLVDFPLPTPHLSLISHRKAKLALCGVMLAFYLSAELGWFNFSTTMYQYLEVQMDATTAARTMSILSATYTVGRLLSALITIKVVPDILLFCHYFIVVCGLSMLFLGRNSRLIIYIGSALLGYGYSACLPAIFAFTQRHLGLSAKVNSVLAFMAGVLSLVTPLIMGMTFHAHPMMLFAIEVAFIAVSLTAFVSVRVWIAIDARKK